MSVVEQYNQLVQQINAGEYESPDRNAAIAELSDLIKRKLSYSATRRSFAPASQVAQPTLYSHEKLGVSVPGHPSAAPLGYYPASAEESGNLTRSAANPSNFTKLDEADHEKEEDMLSVEV
jgi:hypothetical protein